MRKRTSFQRARRRLFLGPALLAGCVTVPSGIEPVRDFDIQRYLGTWYEIARAQRLGFKTNKLIFVEHDRSD